MNFDATNRTRLHVNAEIEIEGADETTPLPLPEESDTVTLQKFTTFDDKKTQRPAPNPASGPISGLPKALPPGAVAALFEAGNALAVGAGERLTVYRLARDSGHCNACDPVHHTLPGRACAVAASSLGLVVAVDDSGCSRLVLVGPCEPITVWECPGKVNGLAAAGAHAYAVVVEGHGCRARLVRVNLRQRAVAAECPLPRGQVTVSVDPAGQTVVVSDPVGRGVTPLGPDLNPKAAPSVPAAPDPGGAPGASGRHDDCCCCGSCRPVGADGGPAQPGGPGTTGTVTGTTREPAGPGSGQTGTVGTPTGDGGIVVGDGGRVDRHPPAGSGKGPCGRNLFFEVATLLRVGPYVLASDRQARSVAVLSADMNLLDEWQFGRGGAELLAAEGSSTLVVHFRGQGHWEWRDLHEAMVRLRPDLERFPIGLIESKTFIGQLTYPMSHGQQPSPSAIKGLLIPVVEGDQAFNSPNLGGFGAFMNRTMLPVVKDYYDENSFGVLKDVDIAVFGVNVGPVGGPLRLPRAKLADYFFPKYEPARLELVKAGVTAADEVVLDGREALAIQATPLTGGPAGGTLNVPFFALAFQRDEDLFPVQVKFFGTETLTLDVTLPDGKAKVLKLVFTAKTFDVADDSAVVAKTGELTTYLDGVMKAAGTAAGLTTQPFAAPKVVRISQVGKQFGRLLVTFNAASATGNKLRITGTSAALPGGDPMGLAAPILGTIGVSDTGALNTYLDNATLLAQEAAKFGYNARLLNPPTAAFDSAAKTFTTSVAISDRDGGPGAEVKLVSSSGLETLFDTATARPNSATTANSAQALRDGADLYRDVFTAANDRLRKARQPTDALKDFGCVLLLPVEPATPAPADPTAVLPSEVWNVTPLYRPFEFRGAENITTVVDRADEKVQLQSAWALIFMTGGKPDNPIICHELGHAIGYADLYFQTGYRDELGYMGGWAMMDSHWDLPHHCGYHKLQSQWIPDGAGTEADYGRVFPLGLPDSAKTRTWDLLLVPIELWRNSLVGSSRAAFGVGGDVPVVQLAWIDLGGDGATFGLIEARQPGARFSKKLPDAAGGVLITNGITWKLDERFATNGWYRRPLQLLNPGDVLHAPGDTFDLAMAAELAVKGVTVAVVDRKLVEGDAQVYRVKVTRENAEFIDLYFDSPEIYYKNPDLWIDWVGNNTPNPDSLTPDFPLGQPTDQGEAIRVHPSRPEPHWVVARLRNRGKVKALDVKLNFFYYEPPGGGDGGKPLDANNASHYKLIGSLTTPEIPGGDDPRKVLMRWDVPPGFQGHTCLLVQIEDFKIPKDSKGAALGSDDVWPVNNHAQKNVDKFEALSASPFAPVEFDFSVHNAGVTPELSYPEPDGLPYGMRLTVTPPWQSIASGATAIFRCKLELDERIISTGCENDQRFRLHAWRQDPESSVRWGGVEYEIRPREKTATQLGGSWDFQGKVTLTGKVAPDPGGGTVRIRVDFDSQQAHWVTAAATAGGLFTWTGTAPANSGALEAVAWFEGNRKFGSSRSNPAKVSKPEVPR